jgi:hypothetical protein
MVVYAFFPFCLRHPLRQYLDFGRASPITASSRIVFFNKMVLRPIINFDRMAIESLKSLFILDTLD